MGMGFNVETSEKTEGVFLAVQALIKQVFEDETVMVGRGSSLRELEGWDWEMHVTLMIAVETHFGVRFSVSEMAYLADVAGLVKLIEAKQIGSAVSRESLRPIASP